MPSSIFGVEVRTVTKPEKALTLIELPFMSEEKNDTKSRYKSFMW